MTEWIRARRSVPCGSCRQFIRGPFKGKPGDPLLEVRNGGAKLARCAACAKRIFGEDPPSEFPEDSLLVPVPTLPLERIRRPDFVTPRQLAQVNQYADFKSRQAAREPGEDG